MVSGHPCKVVGGCRQHHLSPSLSPLDQSDIEKMRSVETLNPRTARATTLSGDPDIIPGVTTLEPRTARAAARLLLRLLGAGYSDYLATSAISPPPSEERYLLLTRV